VAVTSAPAGGLEASTPNDNASSAMARVKSYQLATPESHVRSERNRLRMVAERRHFQMDKTRNNESRGPAGSIMRLVSTSVFSAVALATIACSQQGNPASPASNWDPRAAASYLDRRM